MTEIGFTTEWKLIGNDEEKKKQMVGCWLFTVVGKEGERFVAITTTQADGHGRYTAYEGGRSGLVIPIGLRITYGARRGPQDLILRISVAGHRPPTIDLDVEPYLRQQYPWRNNQELVVEPLSYYMLRFGEHRHVLFLEPRSRRNS